MNAAQEIEAAISTLSPAERAKLLHQIPRLFPEFARDSEWERIIADERTRLALTELVNQCETDLSTSPDKFSKVSQTDFKSKA
jgi:hypothetical protein